MIIVLLFKPTILLIEQNFHHEIEELKRENETLKQTVNRLESELEGQTMNEEYFKR